VEIEISSKAGLAAERRLMLLLLAEV